MSGHYTHPDPAVRALIAEAEVRGAVRALRSAASDPALRLSGHSGVSVRGLRARADHIEAAR